MSQNRVPNVYSEINFKLSKSVSLRNTSLSITVMEVEITITTTTKKVKPLGEESWYELKRAKTTFDSFHMASG